MARTVPDDPGGLLTSLPPQHGPADGLLGLGREQGGFVGLQVALHQQHLGEGLHLGPVAQLGIAKGALGGSHRLLGRGNPGRGGLQ